MPQQGASGNSAAAARRLPLPAPLAQFPRIRLGDFHSERDQDAYGCMCLGLARPVRGCHSRLVLGVPVIEGLQLLSVTLNQILDSGIARSSGQSSTTARKLQGMQGHADDKLTRRGRSMPLPNSGL